MGADEMPAASPALPEGRADGRADFSVRCRGCGALYDGLDDAARAEHREHPTQWQRVVRRRQARLHFGPWHLVVGSNHVTASCGADLYRRNPNDIEISLNEPASDVCPRCLAAPVVGEREEKP